MFDKVAKTSGQLGWCIPHLLEGERGERGGVHATTTLDLGMRNIGFYFFDQVKLLVYSFINMAKLAVYMGYKSKESTKHYSLQTLYTTGNFMFYTRRK